MLHRLIYNCFIISGRLCAQGYTKQSDIECIKKLKNLGVKVSAVGLYNNII